MSAPKTKVKEVGSENGNKASIQLIVFAPINADPEDEDSLIYMVCPSSLKVVEVVDKYGEDAEAYIKVLRRTKGSSKLPAKTFIEDLGRGEQAGEDLTKAVVVEDALIEDHSGTLIDDAVEKKLKRLDEELDPEEDIVAFGELGDIFPDDDEGGSSSTKPDPDMEEALAMLDESEETRFEDIPDFVGEEDNELPTLD